MIQTPRGATAIPRRNAEPTQEHLRGLQRTRQTRVAKALVALFIVAILVIFIIANSQAVEVDFVVATHRIRLIWVMFTCAVLGGILGFLVGSQGMRARLHKKRSGSRGRGADARSRRTTRTSRCVSLARNGLPAEHDSGT